MQDVRQSDSKAFDYFRKAQQNFNNDYFTDGDINKTYYNLAVCYQQGIGTAVNLEKAIDNYTKATSDFLSSNDAMYNLALCHLLAKGVTEDKQKAAELLQKAVKKHNANVHYNLAVCYLQGAGVVQNAKTAASFFRKAAIQGHLHAQNNLAIMYQQGIGLIKSEERAKIWLERAKANISNTALPLHSDERTPLGLSLYCTFKGIDTDASLIIPAYAG